MRMAKATGTPKSFRLTDAELPRFERAVKKYGSVKSAVMAALEALEQGNDVSQAEVIRWIKDHTK